jgi:hypothetical protein
VREKMKKKWGLTEKERIIAWNYEENRAGSGRFFETPVRGEEVMNANMYDKGSTCRYRNFSCTEVRIIVLSSEKN